MIASYFKLVNVFFVVVCGEVVFIGSKLVCDLMKLDDIIQRVLVFPHIIKLVFGMHVLFRRLTRVQHSVDNFLEKQVNAVETLRQDLRESPFQ